MENNTAKLELFRQAIDAQADAEIAAFIQAEKDKAAAAVRARERLSDNAELGKILAEKDRIAAQFRKDIAKCDYEAKKDILSHRSKLIDEFFIELEEEMEEFVSSPQYADFLKRSIERVRTAIALDDNTVIYARHCDVELLRSMTACEVKTDSSIKLGGICAMCKRRGLFTDLTLDLALTDEKAAFSEKTELRL